MIPGKEVEIGGIRYVLPPLNIESMRKHKEFLDKAPGFRDGTTIPRASDVLEMADIIIESLARNYPQAPRDEIERSLDNAKVVECFIAVVAAGNAGPALGENKPGNP